MLEEKFGLARFLNVRSTFKIGKLAKNTTLYIKVPRFYGFNEHKGDIVELHILTDLQQLAYGTCAYFRIIEGNDIKISFIIGKSRLAPRNSKVPIIPKLELQAAVIASK